MSREHTSETGRRGFLGALSAIKIVGARLPEPVLALSGVEAAPRN